MDEPYRAAADVTILPNHLAIPGVGVLQVNTFVLHSARPGLVDTGIALDASAYIEALRSVIDPAELEWIWVSHDDSDHTGALQAVMELAPDAVLYTHALGALRMSTWWPIPLERVHALVPGEHIDAGDRTLVALRPPTYDNPTSTGFFDEKTRTLFAVDSFGAILPDYVTDLDTLSEEALVGGMTVWATFDAPWVHLSDRGRFASVLDDVRKLQPEHVVSAHLPPATGRVEQLLGVVGSVPDAEPFTPPPAEAFAQIVAALRATS